MAGLVESRSKRGSPQWVESRRLRDLAHRDDQWLAQVSRVDVDGLLAVVGPNTELVEAREEIRVIESPPIEHDLGLAGRYTGTRHPACLPSRPYHSVHLL